MEPHGNKRPVGFDPFQQSGRVIFKDELRERSLPPTRRTNSDGSSKEEIKSPDSGADHAAPSRRTTATITRKRSTCHANLAAAFPPHGCGMRINLIFVFGLKPQNLEKEPDRSQPMARNGRFPGAGASARRQFSVREPSGGSETPGRRRRKLKGGFYRPPPDPHPHVFIPL